jgi:hypothetical protein
MLLRITLLVQVSYLSLVSHDARTLNTLIHTHTHAYLSLFSHDALMLNTLIHTHTHAYTRIPQLGLT